MIETRTSFACFGGGCSISVLADGAAQEAVELQRARLLAWQDRFTCFEPDSELMALNADPREVVPAGPDLRRFAAAVGWAHAVTGGLVDGTLSSAVAKPRASLPLRLALRLAPPRRSARGRAVPRIRVDDATIRRPTGLTLDSGGLAKGLFADMVAEALSGHAAVAVDCAGDLRVTGMARPVHVADPFGGPDLHTFELGEAAVATSGIGRRAWLTADGRPAHHLLDPATGAPAYTGIVQATAVAPTALEAEVRAKAALLSGPDGAAGWLPFGGVLVFDDGSTEVLALTPVGRHGSDDRVAFHEVQHVEALAQLPRLRVA
jgi:thiamine biosynthesis lipoprotein